MRKMVEDGKAKPEDVERRLMEMRKMMGERGERKREGAARDDDIDWKSIKRRIEGAVKRGDMTGEEADAKYREIKERMGKRRDKEHEDKELDYDAIGRRLKAAVKAGKLTEEEAKAKWIAIKQKAADKD
ncbi:MAG: hypothetical protein ACYSWZ_10430 [Planctomycetota bacterium]|jgi:hypothetical protein